MVEDLGLLREIEIAKRNKLADIFQRMISNPATAMEVATEIAADWFPLCQVDRRGEITFILGTGQKK